MTCSFFGSFFHKNREYFRRIARFMEGDIHMNRDQVITYEPDNSIRKGYWSVFAEIMREVTANQWLIYQLFKRDFSATYKKSFIGVFWVLIIPLTSFATFAILNRQGL